MLLLVGLVAVRLLLRLFDRALERSRLERAAYAMLRSVMKVLLYFILLLLVAAQLGVDVQPGGHFKRHLSGPVPGSPGSPHQCGRRRHAPHHPSLQSRGLCGAGDQSGTVLEVSVTYTKLQTPDNKIVSIPNSTAAAARITNFSAAGTRRVDLTVSASYRSPVESVKAALLGRPTPPPACLPPSPLPG